MLPFDAELFLLSARTDAKVRRLQSALGSRAAFEAIYQELNDPWASGDPRFRYQRRKYADIIASLPQDRRFTRVLDMGCGLGLLSERLSRYADTVLGVDIAEAAISRAAKRGQVFGNLQFAQGDVTDLPSRWDGQFDLVMLVDTLYYLPKPIHDSVLKTVSKRIAELLAPGGFCVLANHDFLGTNAESRLSRRIHNVFAASSGLHRVQQRWRPFYLVDQFCKAACDPDRRASGGRSWPA